MQSELLKHAEGLIEDADSGLWVPKAGARQSALSYPESARQALLEIEDTSYWFKHRSRCLIAAMRRLPISGPLLEVGSGNGAVCAALKAEGIEAIPLEPSMEGATNALKRGLDPVICSELRSAGFRTSSLPAIGLFDVLEHIEDDAGFLGYLASLLIHSGQLYITVPAYGALWSMEDAHAGHIRRYSREGLAGLVSRAGLKLEYATNFMLILVPPILLMRTLPYKLGLGAAATKPDQIARQHRLPGGVMGNIIKSSFEWEVRRVGELKSIPFGSSLLCVARRA